MKNVEDIYPVTPMQQLMLLHTTAHRERDRLLTQFGFELSGHLNAEAFKRAWQAVVDHHPMLRTAFVARKADTPLQVVRKRVELPFHLHDWRDHTDPRASLDALRDADRRDGFDPKRAPLMRLHVARVGPRQWYVLWTSHHLLMDRWCLTTLFGDVDAAYEQVFRGERVDLPARPGFGRYVNWLKEQDAAQAEQYWRRELEGFGEPTP
ncbi:MAG: condensation domain-containing protein, partial [Pseudomonadota bacterium]